MGYSKERSKTAGSAELKRIRSMLEEFQTYSRRYGSHGVDVWLPATDVYETQDALIIQMCLPGVSVDQIRTVINGDTITVSGHRESITREKLVAYHQMEIRYGYFERSVTIHTPFDAEQCSAIVEKGILLLKVPKAKKLQSRPVVIRIRL